MPLLCQCSIVFSIMKYDGKKIKTPLGMILIRLQTAWPNDRKYFGLVLFWKLLFKSSMSGPLLRTFTQIWWSLTMWGFSIWTPTFNSNSEIKGCNGARVPLVRMTQCMHRFINIFILNRKHQFFIFTKRKNLREAGTEAPKIQNSAVLLLRLRMLWLWDKAVVTSVSFFLNLYLIKSQ